MLKSIGHMLRSIDTLRMLPADWLLVAENQASSCFQRVRFLRFHDFTSILNMNDQSGALQPLPLEKSKLSWKLRLGSVSIVHIVELGLHTCQEIAMEEFALA